MTKYLEEFTVYIGRVREHLKEARELSVYLELQGAKLDQCEGRTHTDHAHGVGVLSAETMQLLEDELDLITDLQYANRVKMDELKIEVAHTKSVIRGIVDDVSRDSTVCQKRDF